MHIRMWVEKTQQLGNGYCDPKTYARGDKDVGSDPGYSVHLCRHQAFSIICMIVIIMHKGIKELMYL